MLHLFYGRENIDKDKFLFDVIKEKQGKYPNCILLVPDQFTLQAERDAFNYLKVCGLMDIEILSISRLGVRILEERGGAKKNHINKYGRHMLLTKILREEEKNLKAFFGMSGVNSFIEMLNNFLSEMKQYNADETRINNILENIDEDSLLKRKLSDVKLIYKRYEEEINGKYVDTEDYIKLFASKISESDFVKDSVVFISGFDYFTPKNLDVLGEIISAARDVNVIMTGSCRNGERDMDLFQITNDMIRRLEEIACEKGVKSQRSEIAGYDKALKSQKLSHLEHEIFAYPHREFMGQEKNEGYPEICLCSAANLYGEAESAATYIIDLVRNENIKYKDILVICNDMEMRASIIKRVFNEYGIKHFIDKKRNMVSNPVLDFVDGLMDLLVYGWNYQTVFRLVKTGFFVDQNEDWLDFENYVIKYKIIGGKWKKDLKYGTEAKEETPKLFNAMRKEITELLLPFETKFKKAEKADEKTEILYDFLNEKIKLPFKIDEYIEFLNSQNQNEYAMETAQIWNIIVDILNQIVSLLGSEPMTNDNYIALFKAGISDIEVGVLPPTLDEVTIGTMQRTRIGQIKVLVVIGANEGILPSAIKSENIFSDDEKMRILNEGSEICKIDDLRVKEESLGIYKILSKPKSYLWMSYSATDTEGKESKPSLIFNKIRDIFPSVKIHKDILNEGNTINLISTPKSTIRYLTKALRQGLETKNLEGEWVFVKDWYMKSDSYRSLIDTVIQGFLYTNNQMKIEKAFAKKLYNKTIFSPSQLESFARCPFSYFTKFGLKPEERRIFEVTGREMGDIYHETILKVFTGGEPHLLEFTKEECEVYVSEIMEQSACSYREGILRQGSLEEYRLNRMKKVCGRAVFALLKQLNQGDIKNMYFESKFGKDKDCVFPAIPVETADNTYFIEGKIDRVDLLDHDYVKIIDYKSGKEKFAIDEVKAGTRLQLLLYLKAAMQNSLKPGGVFYFEIADPIFDASFFKTEELEKKRSAEEDKSYRLDGVVLDEDGVIEGITGEFMGYSDILPIKKNKDGIYVGTTENKLLSEEDFQGLLDTIDEKAKEICTDLMKGKIDVNPKKSKTFSACTFCQYKSICNFDLSFDGCAYDMIK